MPIKEVFGNLFIMFFLLLTIMKGEGLLKKLEENLKLKNYSKVPY